MVRYDLILHRGKSGASQYVGRASDREEAERWALARLRREDIHLGDRITAHKLGEREPTFEMD